MEYFKRHSPNFAMDGMHDQTKVFRHMAESAKLLGLAIYKIQKVWKGPDELQKANFALRFLPKGLKIPLSSTPIGVPKGYGIGGHT